MAVQNACTSRRCLVFIATLLLSVFSPSSSAAAAQTAAVFYEAFPGAEEAFARELVTQVEAAGYAARLIDSATLTNSTQVVPANFELLVLPNARSLPANSAPALEGFLRGGGKMLALGLPAWQSPRFQINGQWFSRETYEQTLAIQKPQHLLEDFDHADLAKWTRSTSDPRSSAQRELVQSDHGLALRVRIENFTGWDTLASPSWAEPFPAGHALTCFRAKGSPRTHQLALEWTEQDGARWIATVDLTPDWKQYVLPPEAFHFWQSVPSRGSKGDRLNVRRAVRFTAGLAQSHTAVEGTQHEYWLDDLGTAPNPFGVVSLPASPGFPRLESFSPEYQFFPITAPAQMAIPQGLAFLTPAKLGSGDSQSAQTRDGTGLFQAMHPRPQGAGFDQQRPWRWQPLLEARAADGDYRGALGLLLVHVRPPFRGGIWASFTPENPVFYRQPAMKRTLHEVLNAMRRGVFLQEGGGEFFTVFDEQTFRLGARVVNFGREVQPTLAVRLAVTDKRGGRPVFEKEWKIDLAPGADRAVEQAWKPATWPEDGFRVTTELLLKGEVIDRLSHDLNVWQPKPQPEFVEARAGGLWLRGQPWKAHGVNYMPSSGIAVADGSYFEYWLGRGAYDPEVIERDLRRIKAMNLNAVSVFVYHHSLQDQHLLDFLRRCGALDLKVNQSLRPGTPLDFRWQEMKELIEFYRLARNDTVFAYDLAWEPSHFDHAHQQKSYGTDWNAWVVKRYGSIPAAEKAWGVTAPRDEKVAPSIAVPSMQQLTQDGPWRKLIADYRFFLDNLLGAKYAEARRLVKSIDPHHAVSFRMQHAGDPTYNWDRMLPYDFFGLADAVDIWEPEAYGRIGDWDKVKGGHFTASYARLCDAKKPVVWAEMGYNVWDMSRMAPHPEKVAFASHYYSDFYRMMIESGANGVFFWWYPGGFRVNENSDFGIINADGTDRTFTQVIRNEGARFLTAPKPPPPNYWIPIDRDRDARGLFGVYESVKNQYWQVVGEGKTPGLKWLARPGGGKTE